MAPGSAAAADPINQSIIAALARLPEAERQAILDAVRAAGSKGK
jgi:hypothetical protein